MILRKVDSVLGARFFSAMAGTSPSLVGRTGSLVSDLRAHAGVVNPDGVSDQHGGGTSNSTRSHGLESGQAGPLHGPDEVVPGELIPWKVLMIGSSFRKAVRCIQ